MLMFALPGHLVRSFVQVGLIAFNHLPPTSHPTFTHDNKQFYWAGGARFQGRQESDRTCENSKEKALILEKVLLGWGGENGVGGISAYTCTYFWIRETKHRLDH